MTYNLRFVPEVEEDGINGHLWYESKSKGLGEEFLRIFYAAASAISHNPLQYPIVYHEFRRCLLRRFPYAVYFQVDYCIRIIPLCAQSANNEARVE